MSYVVVARWIAQDEHEDEIEAIVREFVPRCGREPGYRDFAAHKSVERPNEFRRRRLRVVGDAAPRSGDDAVHHHHQLLHFGMTVAFAGQMKVDEVTGGSPYGATTIAGLDAQRQPSKNELAGARYQRRAIAETAAKLHG